MPQILKKHYYKACIQYDGTGYAGFQWQADLKTIQNDFNLALGSLVGGKITTMSASRTDSGVHALEQFVKITSEKPIENPEFIHLFNNSLPAQIRCIGFQSCSSEFKPASDAVSKEYRYYFINKKFVTETERRFVANFSKTLNFEAIYLCIEALQGIHNFQNFCSAGSNVKTTMREITFCELTQINPQSVYGDSKLFPIPSELTHCYQLQIKGRGFLKQMIRHIVSGLWMVGSGKITTDDFMMYLNGPKQENRIWKVAPANGLVLYQINYPQ